MLYAAAAIFSAILMGAFVCNLQLYLPTSGQHAQPDQILLNTFSSLEELRDFLTVNSGTQGFFPFYSPSDIKTLTTELGLQSDVVYSPGSLKIPEFSSTNIQVAGVDEADIVKTDGEHIYLISGNSVIILKAYPPKEAQVLSKITIDNTYPAGIFVSQKRLVVLGSRYTISKQATFDPRVVDIKTSVSVYDISNKTQPELLRNLTITGSYFHSRMIGEYVYFVVSQPAYVIYDTVILPKIYIRDGVREISPSEIYHANVPDNYFLYTTVIALNVHRTEEEPSYKTLMLGGTSSMYVSLKNAYISFPEPGGQTSIYRISIDRDTLRIEAHGLVPGRELNQFSMDEYGTYFRIATATRENGTVHSNVYILRMNLTIAGRLENIAPGEALDSARFIGDRAYLSTSVVRRDPFFVVDVENATAPKILGYLKIPGFTRYLHPYDTDRLMGIGKDGGAVKISLFDVTNVSAPIELDKYSFEGSWSDTPVLTEHKALLFDKTKDLLVLPVSIWNWSYSPSPYSLWHPLWQGACVFKVTLADGIVFRGSVTHVYFEGEMRNALYHVKRELYIENVLYTVSDKMVKMSNLSDLSMINLIVLS